MRLTILAFAQIRDQLGFQEQEVEFTEGETPRQIMTRVAPDMDWSHIRVAVDCEYVEWDSPLNSSRELALIPPVSGG